MANYFIGRLHWISSQDNIRCHVFHMFNVAQKWLWCRTFMWHSHPGWSEVVTQKCLAICAIGNKYGDVCFGMWELQVSHFPSVGAIFGLVCEFRNHIELRLRCIDTFACNSPISFQSDGFVCWFHIESHGAAILIVWGELNSLWTELNGWTTLSDMAKKPVNKFELTTLKRYSILTFIQTFFI